MKTFSGVLGCLYPETWLSWLGHSHLQRCLGQRMAATPSIWKVEGVLNANSCNLGFGNSEDSQPACHQKSPTLARLWSTARPGGSQHHLEPTDIGTFLEHSVVAQLRLEEAGGTAKSQSSSWLDHLLHQPPSHGCCGCERHFSTGQLLQYFSSSRRACQPSSTS